MPVQPAYITRNRHGTFYFRMVVPLPVRNVLGMRREIRRSLKTDSQRLALRRARQYVARFDAVFDKVLNVVDRNDYIPTDDDLRLLNEEIERADQTVAWGAWASEPVELAQPTKSTLSDDEWRELDERQRWDAIAALLNGKRAEVSSLTSGRLPNDCTPAGEAGRSLGSTSACHICCMTLNRSTQARCRSLLLLPRRYRYLRIRSLTAQRSTNCGSFSEKPKSA